MTVEGLLTGLAHMGGGDLKVRKKKLDDLLPYSAEFQKSQYFIRPHTLCVLTGSAPLKSHLLLLHLHLTSIALVVLCDSGIGGANGHVVFEAPL